MKKEQVTGGALAAMAVLVLLWTGFLYRPSGFGLHFIAVLVFAAAAVPALLLAGFRRLGGLPVWLAIALSLPALFFSSGDAATSVLIWALCCGTPLAVTLLWPRYKKIKQMTVYALPAAGAIWLGGALVYCRLHFGVWALSAMTDRIALRFTAMLDDAEELSLQLYDAETADQLSALFSLYRESAASMGFMLVMMAVYALFGLFFLSLLIADRSVPAESRWLGSWKTLVPGPGISWIYMLGYLLIMAVSGTQALAMDGVFCLFGFFYVFTALYYLLQWLRKKNLHPVLCGILIGVLFGLAYLTSGSALFGPYTILMYVGWWIATSVGRYQQLKEQQ